MKTIWKYKLEVEDKQIISVPMGFTILKVGMQFGYPFLLVEVDDENKKVEVEIFIFGTGHPINVSYLKYIGTFFVDEGYLVFHVFYSNKE